MTQFFGKKRKTVLSIMFLIAFFSMTPFVLADGKSLTLSTTTASPVVGDKIEVKIVIDTLAEKVNAIGFDINFPTENLEASPPSSAGTVFPMSGGSQSSTRWECGISGKNGFSGQGLVTTLNFTAKTAGDAIVTINNLEAHMTSEINGKPVVTNVTGFSINPVTITVYNKGQQPATPTSTPDYSAGSEKISPQESTLKPSAEAMAVPTQKNTDKTGQSKGSKSSVSGQTGSNKESPIQFFQGGTNSKGVLIKGASANNPLYYGLIPTLLLLAMVVNLGIKLYFTEKKRHLELVHLFDTHLGALSSLESKLDLVDSKGEIGKDAIIQDFEETKNQFLTEEKNKFSKGK